jgi:hypothetical protein
LPKRNGPRLSGLRPLRTNQESEARENPARTISSTKASLLAVTGTTH